MATANAKWNELMEKCELTALSKGSAFRLNWLMQGQLPCLSEKKYGSVGVIGSEQPVLGKLTNPVVVGVAAGSAL